MNLTRREKILARALGVERVVLLCLAAQPAERIPEAVHAARVREYYRFRFREAMTKLNRDGGEMLAEVLVELLSDVIGETELIGLRSPSLAEALGRIGEPLTGDRFKRI